jgi:hypothetical protein
MAVAVARIRSFIEKMEASLAPPTDHRRWIRLLDLEYGETDEAAIAAHLIRHPEDGPRLDWLQWVRTCVPRSRDPVGERSSDYQLPTEAAPEKPAAPPAAVANATTEKPAAPLIATEHERVPGFGDAFGRRPYDPVTGC